VIPKITDAASLGVGKDTSAFIQTVKYLSGTPLPAMWPREVGSLKSLLGVYEVCIELQTAVFERAVFNRMANYQYPNMDTLVAFAREVYGDTASEKRVVDSSVGQVVKAKLTAFLPRLLREETSK
jgi:hypothetical protein